MNPRPIQQLFRSAFEQRQYAISEVEIPTLATDVEREGVAGILHMLDCHHRRLPPAVFRELQAVSVARTAWESCHQTVLSPLLAELARIAATPVILKGTALAYSLYAQPFLRERSDTDLLVPGDRLLDVERALRAMEWSQRDTPASTGYQSQWFLICRRGYEHTLDVHWRINNSELLSGLFSYDELMTTAIQLPRLAPEAYGTDPVSSFVIACMHRATHRTNPYYHGGHANHSANRLIWLFDIHLLASTFGAREWDAAARTARDKGLAHACLDGLHACETILGTRVPAEVFELFRASGAERASRYLAAGAMRQGWLDLLAHRAWSDRVAHGKQLLFPPSQYMREKYRDAPVQWVPWLYVRRIVTGLARRLSYRASDRRSPT
jgi:hypothetical protein